MLADHHPAGALGVLPVTTGDPHRLLAEPAQELTPVGDLAAGLGERLAHLEGHEQRELVGALGQQVERAPEDVAARSRCRGRPVILRLDGRVEGADAVFGRRVGDLDEHVAGGRVVHRERAAGALDPLPSDEQPARDLLEQGGFGDQRAASFRRRVLAGASIPSVSPLKKAGRLMDCQIMRTMPITMISMPRMKTIPMPPT